MKTWLKGGLIGAGIYLILVGFLAIYCVSGKYLSNVFPGLFGEGGGLLCIFLIAMPFAIIPMLITYFVIGAIIGLIVQKIRGK